MKCTDCDEEAEYYDPRPQCENHWMKWYSGHTDNCDVCGRFFKRIYIESGIRHIINGSVVDINIPKLPALHCIKCDITYLDTLSAICKKNAILKKLS